MITFHGCTVISSRVHNPSRGPGGEQHPLGHQATGRAASELTWSALSTFLRALCRGGLQGRLWEAAFAPEDEHTAHR